MSDSFQLKAIITAVDKMSPALKGIKNAVKGVHKSLRDIGSAGSELMNKIGLPAGLAFLGISAGIKEAVSSLLEYGGALQDASDRTGMSVEMLQALRWSAGQAGVEAGALDASMVKLNKALSEGAAGDATLQGLFSSMKVPLRDAHHQVRALGDVLPEIAESFKNTVNPAVRTRMAMALFGKEGTKLVPMLALGKAGIKDLMAEAERLGVSLDGNAVSSLDNLGDSLFTVTTQIRAQLGTALAGAVKDLKPLIDGLSEWIGKNKQLIQSSVTNVVKEVATWFKSVDWARVGRDISSLWRGLVGVVNALGGVRTIAIGMGIAFAAGPLASILSIVMAVGRMASMFGTLALANPIVLAIVAGIAALAAVIYLVQQNWDTLGPVIMDVLGPMQEALAGLGTAIGEAFSELWGAFRNLLQVLSPLLPVLKVVGAVIGLAILGSVLLTIKAVEKLVDVFSTLFKAAASVYKFIGDGIGSVSKFFGIGGPGAPAAGSGGAPIISPMLAAAGGGNQQMNGALQITFDGAPPGMRVGQPKTTTPNFVMNTDVGYRSGFLGTPD